MVKHKNKNSGTKSERNSRKSVTAYIHGLYGASAPLLLGEGVLFIVAAVLLLLKPLVFLTALTFVIGIALIIFGLYRTIAGFVVNREIGGGWLDVIFGVVNIVLGVLFCVYPAGSMISLMYVFIILFLFKAIGALVFAINMARARFGHYAADLIIALLLVGLAVFLLFYPIAGAVAMVYYLGITLLLYAAADIYMYIELHRLKKRIAE